MKAGKKKNRGTTEKITKFPAVTSGMEDLEDEELDALLEEELKREADELEARLNSDPKLIGVGASDDLFEKIVSSLKEQGVWEEDRAEVKEKKEGSREAAAREAESEEERKLATTETNKSEAGEKETEEKARTEKQNKEAEKKIEEYELQAGSDRKETAQEKTGRADEKMAEESVKDDKNQIKMAYPQLSEEDRRAMEYGYEMQQRDAKKKARRQKRRKIEKRVGITAAALVAVFGVSMTSEANRKYVLEMWNAVVENRAVKIEIGYSEKGVIRENYLEEKKAREQIKESLKMEPIEFKYLPDGWSYFSCEVNEIALSATMYYEKDDMWFTARMYKNEKENILYNQYDGIPQKVECIKNSQGLNIDLYKNGEKEAAGYTIVFNNNEDCYCCNGRVSYEEMKKIAENIVI